MAKAKIRSIVKKRFRMTRRGKILHKSGAVSHRTSKERSTVKTRGRRERKLTKAERTRVKKLLGK